MALSRSAATEWYFSCISYIEFALVMGTTIYRRRILLMTLSWSTAAGRYFFASSWLSSLSLWALPSTGEELQNYSHEIEHEYRCRTVLFLHLPAVDYD